MLFTIGCDQSFNPKGEFQKALVVYSVLSTASDTVLIRVNHTYDPAGFDPFAITHDQTVPDAVVQLLKDDTAYTVRDTILARTDTSRYSGGIKSFVATGPVTTFGSKYTVDASSPTYGTTRASFTMPGKGLIVLANSYILSTPQTFKKDTLFLAIHLSPITRGYLLRAYLEYEFSQGTQTTSGRMEVPVYRATGNNGLPVDPQLPVLHRRDSSPNGSGIESGVNDWFQVYGFLQTADRIHTLNPYATVRRAVFVLNQVEPGFYNYYNVATGFRDNRSIRVDEPSFTNIRSGEGVFGGFTVEEEVYELPISEYN